jgi:hypothetical protein
VTLTVSSKSCTEGLPRIVVLNYVDRNRERNDVMAAIPPDLRLRHEIHGIRMSVIDEMAQSGLTLDSLVQANLLTSITKLSDAPVV